MCYNFDDKSFSSFTVYAGAESIVVLIGMCCVTVVVVFFLRPQLVNSGNWMFSCVGFMCVPWME